MKSILLVLLAITFNVSCFDVSYNQPTLSANASWNANATTFVNSSIVGYNLYDIFVSINNTVYVLDTQSNRVLVWSEGSLNVTRTVSGTLNNPHSLFVDTTGNIYVDNGNSNGRVDKWGLNATASVAVMNVSNACYGLFVDRNNSLYCCIRSADRVIKKSLSSGLAGSSTVVAGTGSSGSSSSQLNDPQGIFIDVNFTLYVADTSNDRIQRFTFGQLNGTTVAGSAAIISFTLHEPTDVVLDADGYLFIVDMNQNRIVGSGPNGFRCVAACTGSTSGSTGINQPQALSFDSCGNIFVTDSSNGRIQKFLLSANSCNSTSSAQNIHQTTTVITESITNASTAVLSTVAPTVPSSSTQSSNATTLTTISTSKIITNTESVSSLSPVTETVLNETTIISTSIVQDVTSIDQFQSIYEMTSSSSTVTNTDSSLSSLLSSWTQYASVSTAVTPTIHGSVMATTSVVTDTASVELTSSSTMMTKTSSMTVSSSFTQSVLATTITDPMPPTSVTTVISNVSSTIRSIIIGTPSLGFFPSTCNDSHYTGPFCNVSTFPCDIVQPCENAGTCINNNSVTYDYFCLCPSGFNGRDCQFDIHLCKPHTCWNNGTCLNVSNTDFLCRCVEGWQGIHCESRIDYCENVTCENNGVCRSLFRDYRCECLNSNFNGRHCEMTSKGLTIREIAAKSFGYIAILSIVSACGFVVMLDVLKYGFRTDPTAVEFKKSPRKNVRRIKNKTTIAIRYIYVDKPKSIATLNQTIV